MNKGLLSEKQRWIRLLVAAVFYQVIWFSAVGAATKHQGLLWLLVLSLAFPAVMMAFWPSCRSRVRYMMLSSAVVGFIVDSFMTASGSMTPARFWMPFPIIPLWLMALWLAFGVFIATGLDRLYGRFWVAAIAGALGGPLAYYGGTRFGALQLGQPLLLVWLKLSVVWAGAFSLLVFLASQHHLMSSRMTLRTRRDSKSRGKPYGKILFGLASFFLLSTSVVALEGDTSRFAEQKIIHGETLSLQGVGRLRRFMITGCDTALYTPESSSLGTLLDGSPVALEFLYYVNITGRQFAATAERTLRQNLSSDEWERFELDIEAMGKLYRDVRSGDRYLIYFMPGKGLMLDFNGRRVGQVECDDFALHYLRIWLGSTPIDENLLAGMTSSMRK